MRCRCCSNFNIGSSSLDIVVPSTYPKICKQFFANATIVVNPYMGTCYSFNYHPPSAIGGGDERRQVLLGSVLAGELYGLELKLDLASNLYLENGLSPRLGAKLLLHEPDHLPIISAQGIGLAPNHMYTLAMDRSTFVRQKAPYPSHCRDAWDPRARLSQEQADKMPYDATLCQSFCLDQEVQVRREGYSIGQTTKSH